MIVETETGREKSARRRTSARLRRIGGAGSSRRPGDVAANLQIVEEVRYEGRAPRAGVRNLAAASRGKDTTVFFYLHSRYNR